MHYDMSGYMLNVPYIMTIHGPIHDTITADVKCASTCSKPRIRCNWNVIRSSTRSIRGQPQYLRNNPGSMV